MHVRQEVFCRIVCTTIRFICISHKISSLRLEDTAYINLLLCMYAKFKY